MVQPIIPAGEFKRVAISILLPINQSVVGHPGLSGQRPRQMSVVAFMRDDRQFELTDQEACEA